MNMPNDTAPELPKNTMGVVGLILSCIGLVLCVFSLPGLIVSIIATRREPRTAAVAGVITGGIGTLFGLLIIPLLIGLLLPALSKAREQAREITELRKVTMVQKGLLAQSDEIKPTPSVAHQMLGETDSWGNPYRVEADGSAVPKISSAGPDGAHGTDDDIHPVADDARSDDDASINNGGGGNDR